METFTEVFEDLSSCLLCMVKTSEPTTRPLVWMVAFFPFVKINSKCVLLRFCILEHFAQHYFLFSFTDMSNSLN